MFSDLKNKRGALTGALFVLFTAFLFVILIDINAVSIFDADKHAGHPEMARFICMGCDKIKASIYFLQMAFVGFFYFFRFPKLIKGIRQKIDLGMQLGDLKSMYSFWVSLKDGFANISPWWAAFFIACGGRYLIDGATIIYPFYDFQVYVWNWFIVISTAGAYSKSRIFLEAQV